VAPALTPLTQDELNSEGRPRYQAMIETSASGPDENSSRGRVRRCRPARTKADLYYRQRPAHGRWRQRGTSVRFGQVIKGLDHYGRIAITAQPVVYGCSGTAAREPLERWTRSVIVDTAAAQQGSSSY
jgi:hypothetical protein